MPQQLLESERRLFDCDNGIVGSNKLPEADMKSKISKGLSYSNFHPEEAQEQFLRHLMVMLSSDCVALSTRA